MTDRVQLLVDRVWEDLGDKAEVRQILHHGAFQELTGHPRDTTTPILLEMLWHDPNWIIVLALNELHGADSPTYPLEDVPRIHAVSKHWVKWGLVRGYLGPMHYPREPDERTYLSPT